MAATSSQLKTANEWAREFKLHHCLNSAKFAEQVLRIQAEAFKAGEQAGIEKQKRLTRPQT